jgi:hypothetical protein
MPGPPPGRPADGATLVANIERAVDDLARLDELPVAEHVTRFEATHATLTEALSTIDKV